MLRPFLLLAALAAACGTPGREEDAPTTSRVVIRPPDVDSKYEPKQPPEWFDEQVRAARAAFEEERLGDALRILYEARQQNPGPRHREAIYGLLQDVNRAVLELPTLEASFAADRDPITFGEDVVFRVRFRNVSGRPLRVPARLEVGASILVLEVTRREIDSRAQVVTTRRRLHQPLGQDLVLAPGEAAELPLSLGLSGNQVPLEGIRTYSLEGMLRPCRLEVGDLLRWDPVPVRQGSLRSLRGNWEHLRDDPVARIGQAVEKGAPVHLITASALVAPGDRQAAVDRLVGLLGTRPAMDYPLYASLQYLTGLDVGREPDAWRIWWRKVREGYFPEAPPEGDGPVFAD